MDDPNQIANSLLREITRAIGEFGLIDDGDRVAVAISGGKDSRALLDLLLRYQKRTPLHYELLALHIDGSEAGLPDLRPDLEPWFQYLGVAYHFAPLELPPDEPLPLDCFRCSWNRRKALFTVSVGQGCDKLAFGHHADDAAVTTLMNLMLSGRLETMEPRVAFFDGAITVIRPLIYVPVKDLVHYANAAGFPEDKPCPQERDSKRAQIEAFLRQFGPHQDQIRTNLWHTARQAMGF